MLVPFKSYLEESRVSKRNFDKVVNIFKRIYERETGEKLFRYGGDRGYVTIKNGIGITFLTVKGKAIRFNYVKNGIESITLWDKVNLDSTGDYTIEMGDIGLLEAGKRLIKLIQNPKVGKFEVEGTLNEDYIMEAKRVKPSEFVVLAQKFLHENPNGAETIQSISKPTINAVASHFNVTKPAFLTTKIGKLRVSGRGDSARFDLTKLPELAGETSNTSSDNDTPLMVKVTRIGKNGKFVGVKGDKDVADLTKHLENIFNDPTPITKSRDVFGLFKELGDLVRVVARKVRPSLLVYGGPGTGKTYTVTSTLKEEGLQKNKDWFIVSGRITTASLYQTLYMHRKGGIIVFDDTDSVWKDPESVNILKAALDSYNERTISWLTRSTINISKMSDEEKREYEDDVDLKLSTDPTAPIKLPSAFDYYGQIIFISNLPESKFDSAVLSRSLKIDMTLTKHEMFERMKFLASQGYIGSKEVPPETKVEIVEYLEEKYQDVNGVDAVTLRLYVAAEDFYRSGVPNWKDLLKYA